MTEETGDGLVRESLGDRLRHALRHTLRVTVGRMFGTRVREETPHEADLRRQCDGLRLRLADQDARVLSLRSECDQLRAEVAVHLLEVRLLTAVAARNQKRVEAETAQAASQIAAYTQMNPDT